MENSLTKIVEQNQLEQSKAQVVLEQFSSFFEQAKEWESKAKKISVTSEGQVEEMQEARKARLALKNIRVEAEKTRKQLKEQALREGKAIDGIANVIKAVIVPIEEHLEKQEKFAEIKEQERIEKRHAERVSLLSQYVPDVSVYQLRDMGEQGFEQLLSTSKAAHDAQKEAERKAEEERIAKEKAEKEEQERIRKENERLKAEAAKREKEEAERRAKEEAEQKKKEEAERKAREEQEAKLRKEREERERVEAELAAKRAEEERIAREKEEADRHAKLAPEKEKLMAYAESIKKLPFPEGLSPEGIQIVKKAETKLLAIYQEIREAVERR